MLWKCLQLVWILVMSSSSFADITNCFYSQQACSHQWDRKGASVGLHPSSGTYLQQVPHQRWIIQSRDILSPRIQVDVTAQVRQQTSVSEAQQVVMRACLLAQKEDCTESRCTRQTALISLSLHEYAPHMVHR
jgi:hypothetical protein